MRITTKLLLWFSATSIAAIVLMGYLNYDRNRDLVMARASDDLLTSTRLLAGRFLQELKGVESDLITLSHLAPVFIGIETPATQETKSPPVRAGLAWIFEDFLQAHPEYLDIRYVALANFGRETVRVNQTPQGIERVAEKNLRENGHFPYLYRTIKLGPGKVHYANVNLKQENALTGAANQPSIKLSITVHSVDQKPVGVIAVTLALNTLFQSLAKETGQDAELYLAGPDSDVLIHPDPNKTFGLDKGHRYRLDQEFSPLHEFRLQDRRDTVIHDPGDTGAQGYVAAFSKIALNPAQPEHVYLMGLRLPYHKLAPVTSAMQQASIEIIITFAICALFISMGLSRLLARPIKQIINAIEQTSGPDHTASALPLNRTDELGVLARTYDELMTRIKQQFESLQTSESSLQHILEAAPLMILILDASGTKVLFANRQAKQLDLTSQSATSNPLLALQERGVPRLGRAGDVDKGVHEGEFFLYDREERPLWLALSTININYQGTPALLAAFTDITKTKENESRITQLAFYDPLTGLPNRRLLLDRLTQAIAQAKRHRTHGAIVFMDLDRFKLLNDTAGHQLGDELLIQAAGRIRAVLRDTDTAARLGGDEFVVVLDCTSETSSTATQEALRIAKRLREALGAPYELSSTVHHCSCSIGLTCYPDHDLQASDYIAQADTAMYLAKNEGGNGITFFKSEMKQAASDRLALEKALRRALNEDQFSLVYQAQVNAQGEAFAAEALIRWHHPQRGMVSPAEFIPIAEQTGLILWIGEWVLRTACTQMKHWSEQGLRLEHISVNVSSSQFWQQDFVQRVQAALQEADIAPSQLMIELTEGVLIDDIEGAVDKLTQLHALGIAVAVDDFGTGYSSLSYLSRLPISQLKIDQSFVGNLTQDPANAVIAETIISMAASLGMAVVAEGVETLAQQAFLQAKGCAAFQGYYYCKPAPAEQFYRDWRGNTASG